jgi:hypothetical protein
MMELKIKIESKNAPAGTFLISTQYGTEGILFQPLAVSCRKQYLFENFTRNENPPFT